MVSDQVRRQWFFPRTIREDMRTFTELLDTVVPHAMSHHHVPGVSLALVAADGSILAGAFGVARAGTDLPVTTETLFEAASLTKPVFATMTVGLSERGLLDLDGKLVDHLPPGWCPAFDLAALTPRIVLSHRTGLPNWVEPGQQPTMRSVPGQTYTYSGLGYMYLQMVVEGLTGRDLQAEFDFGLRASIGMDLSSLVWTAPGVRPFHGATTSGSGLARLDEKGLPVAAVLAAPGAGSADGSCATGHDDDGAPQPKRNWPAPMAAASLHTTPSDYARFLHLFLAPRDVPGVVSTAGLRAMLDPISPVRTGVAWGLGWGLEDTDSDRMFWHWGSNRGFKSFCLASPVLGLGLVVMTNGNQGQSVCEEVVRACFAGPHPALDQVR